MKATEHSEHCEEEIEKKALESPHESVSISKSIYWSLVKVYLLHDLLECIACVKEVKDVKESAFEW